eukprot:3590756-Amphidinium_carterae.1
MCWTPLSTELSLLLDACVQGSIPVPLSEQTQDFAVQVAQYSGPGALHKWMLNITFESFSSFVASISWLAASGESVYSRLFVLSLLAMRGFAENWCGATCSTIARIGSITS